MKAIKMINTIKYILLIIVMMSSASAFSQFGGGDPVLGDCGITSYRDADGDGWGNVNNKTCKTYIPSGYVSKFGDINDNNSLITNIPPKNFYKDADGDGYGNPNIKTYRSVKPSGYVTNGSDYDDSTSLITNIAPRNFYRDADGDGYGNPGNKTYRSVQPSGYVTNSSDCNDGNSAIHPNTVWYKDSDGDGFASTTKKQCTSPGTGYTRTVLPVTDCNDGNSGLNPNTVWYPDSDGDGWGTPADLGAVRRQCNQPSGYVRNSADYNDNNNLITNIAPKNFYRDADGDGYGNPNIKKYVSVRPSGYVTNKDDYNDSTNLITNIAPSNFYRDADGDTFGNPSVKTYRSVRPSGYVTNNSDYDDSTNLITNIAPKNFYQDADGDTFGNPSVKTYRSVRPSGYVDNANDCDDNNNSLNPLTTWYPDSDGDGWGTASDIGAVRQQCSQPLGYALKVGDCNDNDEKIYPETVWYKDSDGDGFASTTKKQCISPGAGYTYTILPVTDCNDDNEFLHPNTVWYKDGDGDNFAISTITQCANPGTGYVLTVLPITDCNDNDEFIHPNTIWYKDSDGDGFAITTKKQCTNPGTGYNQITVPVTDCNDSDASLNPNTIWYADTDNDGWGNKNATKTQCTQPAGYVRNDDDYDDTTIHIINIAPKTFYQDSDGDGFGDPNQSILYSVQPIGYVTNADDQCPTIAGPNNGCIGIPYTEVTISNENYVFTRVYQGEMETSDAITANEDVIESITYFDGLGRPKQQVGIKASPDIKDIVTHIEYDTYGRQAKQYLPFERQGGALGSYAAVDVNTNINNYYLNTYNDDFPGITDPTLVNAYSESVFEASPLNRVQEQGAPGAAWKADRDSDADHTIKFDWDTNTASEVVKFRVTFTNNDTEKPQLVMDNYYVAGELYVTITKDENWKSTDGDNHTTREYKDKQGRVVLKRTYASTGSASASAHDTYYVYDKFGNLTYVIPPKVTTTDGVSTSELAELCYQYEYDSRNRLVEKKIPGKGWEYIIYNKLDQPILTQDPLLKAQGVWLFTKYDALGRIAYTGKYNSTRNRKTLLLAMGGVQTFWEKHNISTVIGETTLYYSNTAFPTTDIEVLTINYYDDYEFNTAGIIKPGTVYGVGTTDRTRSLATGSKVRVLGTNNWITTITYYDKKARPICVASKNEYLNTTDVLESKLDFAGKVLETKTIHTKGSNAAIVTIDTFEYDHMSRALQHTQKIDNQAEETIAENSYDALGQLTSKKIGGTSTALSASLQTVDYTYNVRGWLKSINNGTTAGGDLFGFAIDYNNGTTPLYNGNISKTSWRTANDNVTRSYAYTYDALNRIISGISNDGNYDLSNVTYDKMGNIMSLARHGFQNTTSYTNMDILDYDYDAGNKLLKVTDTGNKSYGFKDGTNTNNDFDYDANGNMIEDKNKGISKITYNHLNLPTKVTISNSEGTGNISYIYDATGTKLKKIAPSGSSLIETEYAGNYVYKNAEIQFMSTTEGYATPEGSSYRYVYQYKDHLGNVRLSYTKNDTGTLEIIEESNYYPFGLTHKGYNGAVSSLGNSTAQLLKFGGKEEQNELGLGWIDITARNYDPALGRWMNLDPLAEQMRRHSPYNYAFNNPIFFIDPDGMAPLDHYIDRRTGEILGQDGAATNELRVIDKREFDYVKEEHGGTISQKATKELQDNSTLVTFDEQQIQDEAQSVGDDTASEGIENQAFITLNVNTGEVAAQRGPDGTSEETIIDADESLGAPRTGNGLMLIAQMHGHPKVTKKGMKNGQSTSTKDQNAAAGFGITVFAIDAFDSKQGAGSERAIHRVKKNGTRLNFAGKTKGTNATGTFNFTKHLRSLLKQGR